MACALLIQIREKTFSQRKLVLLLQSIMSQNKPGCFLMGDKCIPVTVAARSGAGMGHPYVLALLVQLHSPPPLSFNLCVCAVAKVWQWLHGNTFICPSPFLSCASAFQHGWRKNKKQKTYFVKGGGEWTFWNWCLALPPLLGEGLEAPLQLLHTFSFKSDSTSHFKIWFQGEIICLQEVSYSK